MAKQKEKDLEKLTDDDHVKVVMDLLRGHAQAVPQYDRHANKHLYKSISTPEEERTIKELIDDGTLQTAFDKLLKAYLKTADLGEKARDYLTDISVGKEELMRIFAGRLGKVYGPEDADSLKGRLMEKLRTKLSQSVDFSLGNITDRDKLHKAIDYLITEGQLEDQFPSWKEEIIDYGDRAKQVVGSAVNAALGRYEMRGRQQKVYDEKGEPKIIEFPKKYKKQQKEAA